MTLTTDQISAVSAALPGWRHQAYGHLGDVFHAPDDVLEWDVQAAAIVLPDEVEGAIDMRDLSKVRELLDQAAAAAKLLEQFAKEREGKT